jgi:DNA-3-methyladenine glycosylase I
MHAIDTSHPRCNWASDPNKIFYMAYHDHEWGIPVHDDRLLFEMLILEGAQAGLSWETVLKKREAYRKAFYNFDVKKVARMHDTQLESLMQNDGIIRNRLKIFSARRNALAFIAIQKKFGSFDQYIWEFVNHTPILNRWKKITDAPTSTTISDAISKDLKKRGMNFVGSTIIYAYMQAIGMVNDHLTSCFCHPDHAKN